jgi:hypothetical protein
MSAIIEPNFVGSTVVMNFGCTSFNSMEHTKKG